MVFVTNKNRLQVLEKNSTTYNLLHTIATLKLRQQYPVDHMNNSVRTNNIRCCYI
jgi:hypothetical protein